MFEIQIVYVEILRAFLWEFYVQSQSVLFTTKTDQKKKTIFRVSVFPFFKLYLQRIFRNKSMSYTLNWIFDHVFILLLNLLERLKIKERKKYTEWMNHNVQIVFFLFLVEKCWEKKK